MTASGRHLVRTHGTQWVDYLQPTSLPVCYNLPEHAQSLHNALIKLCPSQGMYFKCLKRSRAEIKLTKLGASELTMEATLVRETAEMIAKTEHIICFVIEQNGKVTSMCGVDDLTTKIRWWIRYDDAAHCFSREGLEYGTAGLMRWKPWLDDDWSGGSRFAAAEDPPGYSEHYTHGSETTGFSASHPLTAPSPGVASLHLPSTARVPHNDDGRSAYSSFTDLPNTSLDTADVCQTGLFNSYAATSTVPSWKTSFESSLLNDPFDRGVIREISSGKATFSVEKVATHPVRDVRPRHLKMT